MRSESSPLVEEWLVGRVVLMKLACIVDHYCLLHISLFEVTSIRSLKLGLIELLLEMKDFQNSAWGPNVKAAYDFLIKTLSDYANMDG